MTEEKEKDRILAQIKERKPHGEIAGLEKHLDELVKDGYVSGSFATDGNIITIRTTSQGERFLDNGGYAKSQRTEKRDKVKSELWNGLKFILAAVVGGVIDRLLQIFFGI